MHFLEKNTLFIKHQNADALKADKKLLEEKKPTAKVLTTKFFDNWKEAKEILYELLDVASEEEILKNRKKRMKHFPKPADKPVEPKPEDILPSDNEPEPGEEITGKMEETSNEGSVEPLPAADGEEKKSPEPEAEQPPQE